MVIERTVQCDHGRVSVVSEGNGKVILGVSLNGFHGDSETRLEVSIAELELIGAVLSTLAKYEQERATGTS
jgi:hypothetical protein